MRRMQRALVLVLALLVWPAWAQQPEWCNDIEPAAVHPLSWNNLETMVDAHLAERRYEEAYRHIMTRFEAGYGRRFNDEQAVVQFRAAFEQYLARRASEGDRPEDWAHTLMLAPGRPPAEQYALLAADGATTELRIPCTAFEQDAGRWESPQVAIAYAAYALRRASASSLQLAMQAGAARATSIYQSYQDWLFNGLAMWPWEMKLNELLVRGAFDTPAPRWQWVVLRPNLSTVAHIESFEESELDYALTLEPVGFVRYVEGTDYTEWWGVSPVVAISGDNGGGYGIIGRYNNFVFGAAYHDISDDVLLYLSVDLYKYLLGEKGKLAQGKAFLDAYQSQLLPAADPLR